MRRLRARVWIALQQNRLAIAFVTTWLAANALVFARGRTVVDALEIVLALVRVDSTWGRVYQPFTQVVVFGLVVSVVVGNITRRHRPEATARLLAGQARDHVVVIGHTHLGERVRDAAIAAGSEVVVVDERPERVSTLLHDESPLVLGDPRDEEVLAAAGIAHARTVVVAWDGAEVAAIAACLVRKVNPSCALILRCPDEDIGAVLARTYRARIVSTSQLVAAHVTRNAVKQGTRRAVVLGDNDVARKTQHGLETHGIAVVRTGLEELSPELPRADLVVIADDDLGKNLIRVDRIRDVAPHAKIVCRAFHEEAAAILTKAPFRCEVLSSSRLALDALLDDGVLKRDTRRRAPAPSHSPAMPRGAARAPRA